MLRLLPALLLALSFAACGTTDQIGPLDARPVRTLERWTVHQGEQLLGQMYLLEIEDPRDSVRLYQVRNASDQRLGYMDTQGRVYKWELHKTEETFKGIYSQSEGLALLFEVEGSVDLRSTDNSLQDASLKR